MGTVSGAIILVEGMTGLAGRCAHRSPQINLELDLGIPPFLAVIRFMIKPLDLK